MLKLNIQTPIELGVLKSFEFVSNLRRASVIVRAFGQQSGDVYVKGAPECMKEICTAESCENLPQLGCAMCMQSFIACSFG